MKTESKIKSIVGIFKIALFVLSIQSPYLCSQIVSDDFSDGSATRTGATDLNWYQFSSTTTGTVIGADSGGLGSGNVMRLQGSQPGAIGVLPSAYTLNDGASYTLSFDLRYISSVTPFLRFGLYNDAGTSVTGNNPNTVDDFGSLFYFSGNNFTVIREAAATGGVGGGLGLTVLGSAATNTNIGTTPHNLSLTASRTGSSISYVFSRDGVTTAAVVDSAPLTYNYNYLFLWSSVSGSDIAIDNVTFNAIPEPQMGMFLGLALLVGVVLKIFKKYRFS